MNSEFINSKQNDNFSFLRGTDLQELLVATDNYLLEYRPTLNLPSDLTIGVEIEYEGAAKFVTDRFIKKHLSNWISKRDGSLRFGGEITSPVMTDDPKYWEELKLVCDHLSKRKADTLHNAGGHVHIGANVLGDDIVAWKYFLKLYTAYENIIFRFAYGDKISGRAKIYTYAPPVADLLFREMSDINMAQDLEDFRCILPIRSKYVALNFKHIDFYDVENSDEENTLEFRSPNATTNAVVWQNNINTFAKMLVASKNKVMDWDFLNYKLDYEYLPYSGNEYRYNTVCLKSALEFVDLVFDNNLDKIYFLRQYLKSFQENYGINAAVRAKKFVK